MLPTEPSQKQANINFLSMTYFVVKRIYICFLLNF